ncbi:hypothetical protein DMENIID0001_142070 [Sergentomyia squamirostris]
MKAVTIFVLALCAVALAKEPTKKDESSKDDEKIRESRDVRDILKSPFSHNYYHPFNHYRYQPHVYTPPTYDYNPTVKYAAYKTAESTAPILKLNSDSHPDGSYNYEYETGNGIRAVEQSIQHGLEHVVRGSYSYVAPDGKTYTVHYIADRNGYRAYGDHLPQQPDEVAPLEASARFVAAPSVVVPAESSTLASVVAVTPAPIPVVTAAPVFSPKTVVVPPKTGTYFTQPRYYNPYQYNYNPYNPYYVSSYPHQYNYNAYNPYNPYFVSTVAPSVLVNKK